MKEYNLADFLELPEGTVFFEVTGLLGLAAFPAVKMATIHRFPDKSFDFLLAHLTPTREVGVGKWVYEPYPLRWGKYDADAVFMVFEDHELADLARVLQKTFLDLGGRGNPPCKT